MWIDEAFGAVVLMPQFRTVLWRVHVGCPGGGIGLLRGECRGQEALRLRGCWASPSQTARVWPQALIRTIVSSVFDEGTETRSDGSTTPGLSLKFIKRDLVRKAAQTSRLPLDLNVESYELEDQRNPIDCARQKVLNTMHDMEINLIMALAESHKVTRDSLLMIDGSLQFYRNLEKAKEAFRNVVGVAKSFDLNQRVGTGPNAKEVGTLVTALRQRHRTPARKIEHRNLVIGAWYLRLHSTRSHPSLAATDGVVKLEVFPDDTAGSKTMLDTDRCNLISKNVLVLRHPATPWTDSRWASHLYPVYLTERYIKTRFRSDQTIRACL